MHAQINNKKITLELSQDELQTICNALNEVCRGIEVFEFDKRIGKIEKAEKILDSLFSIHSQINKTRSEMDWSEL